MWFLWSVPPQTFPPHPASAWIRLRPNDTSAAIITYSPMADRRKRGESVLSIPAPPNTHTSFTPRNNPPPQDTAGPPSFSPSVLRSPRRDGTQDVCVFVEIHIHVSMLVHYVWMTEAVILVKFSLGASDELTHLLSAATLSVSSVCMGLTYMKVGEIWEDIN